MKAIRADLPSELENLELHIFADTHVGDHLCDMELLKQRIEYVKNTPNAYCILNGDLIDNATKTSIGDTYTQVFNPMEQLEKAVELFGPIKHKIICIEPGNHENRTYKTDGIDLTALLAAQFGLSDKYAPTGAVVFLRFGPGSKNSHYRKVLYTIYVKHGSRSGRSTGSKANALVDMASTIDCDIYIHSHTHEAIIVKKGFVRVDNKNSAVAYVERLFVNTAAILDFGGYGEVGEYPPSGKETPVIYLNGREKKAKARL